ncbi:MAG: SHOCT domain-containing protein [Candidatus Rokubacteria bacterium]|nr:SHOCT domain-containing protein [Candidatus Rokubacteria bacterium]
MWWMWGAGGIVMMLGMLLFWAAVIAALVVGVRWLVREGRDAREPRQPAPDSALQILRERYARGDISREEFEQRKRDLG